MKWVRTEAWTDANFCSVRMRRKRIMARCLAKPQPSKAGLYVAFTAQAAAHPKARCTATGGTAGGH